MRPPRYLRGREVLTYTDRLDADAKIPCPDLLLLDLSLPKFDGHQILKHLRVSERCCLTPVVVLSSAHWIGDQQNGGDNAPLHYFQKPSSLDKFLELGAIVKGIISATGSSGG